MNDLKDFVPIKRLTPFRLVDWGGFDYLVYDNKRKVYIRTVEEGVYQLNQCKITFTYSNN